MTSNSSRLGLAHFQRNRQDRALKSQLRISGERSYASISFEANPVSEKRG
jgi:hypothetical protein